MHTSGLNRKMQELFRIYPQQDVGFFVELMVVATELDGCVDQIKLGQALGLCAGSDRLR